MNKHPVTIAEMNKAAKRIGLTDYNPDAMRAVCLIARLGFEPTVECYNHELALTIAHKKRLEAEMFDPRTEIVPWDEIPDAPVIGPQEPPQDYRIFNRRQADGTFRPLSEFFGTRTDAQRDLDEWQAETQATQESVRPL